MDLCRIIKRSGVFLCLSLILYAENAAAFPLPTQDMARLAQSAKTTKLQIDEIYQEYQSTMHIIKQIQNGGYAAAAKELFGKIQNGDYDRYGGMVKNLGVSLETGAANAQAVASKKEKRKEINEKLAEKELQRKKEAAEEAQAKAEQKQKESEGLAKKSAWSKAYSWVKKNSVSAVDAISSGVNTLENGGSLKDVYKNTKGSVGNIADNMKNDAKEEAAIKEKIKEREAKEAAYEKNKKEFEESQKEREAEMEKENEKINDDISNQFENWQNSRKNS